MKGWVRNVAALIALLLGFVTWSLMPSKLHVKPARKFPAPKTSVPAGVSIAAIPTGERESRAMLTFRGGSWSEQRRAVVGGILVRHPRGNLLFDTGFGEHYHDHVSRLNFFARSTSRYTTGTPVARQLAAAGIAPRSLHAIVLTHAHSDHVSGLDDLRGVPVWLSGPEQKFITDGGRATELIRRLGDFKFVTVEFPDGPYLGFEHSRDVWGDGSVVLVPTPGHTPGSLAAFITLPNGTRYALLGDIVWQKEGIDLPAERPWPVRMVADWDEHRVRELILHFDLLARAFPSLVMVPAHDARVWATLPKL